MHDRFAGADGKMRAAAYSDPPLTLRVGEHGDLRFIVAMMRIAGAGLFETVLQRVVPGADTDMLLAFAVSDQNNPFFFENAVIAERDGEPQGMALAVRGDLPLVAEELRALVPPDLLRSIGPFLVPDMPNTLYVPALAVDRAARRNRVGTLLLRAMGSLAVGQGLATVALHVWPDNKPAIGFYGCCGFEVAARHDVPAISGLPLADQVWVMTAPSADLADLNRPVP
jgi:ribosomal protein S18 acetylase RimI-like enzyme